MDVWFYLDPVQEALECQGVPVIFNTGPGRQLKSLAFTGLLKQHDIRTSMDGKDYWRRDSTVHITGTTSNGHDGGWMKHEENPWSRCSTGGQCA